MSQITLSHGSGGTLTRELIQQVFLAGIGNPVLEQQDDAARLSTPAGDWCFTTDSFVVRPLRFPGGDIGRLAVCGTVNDLCVSGAAPMFLSCAFIIEEGFPIEDLRRIAVSMHDSAAEAGVQIVTGDTKVVEKGLADGLYINTAGIGRIPPGRQVSGSMARPGDAVIVTGNVGQHGAAIVMARGELALRGRIESDVRPVGPVVEALIAACPEVHVMRDPTRGGLATTLNEIADQSHVSVVVREENIPIGAEVQSMCGLLGLDPLYLACEGRVVAFVPWPSVERVLSALHGVKDGRNARVIGEVSGRGQGQVVLRTTAGGHRPLPMLAGEPVPRIC